MDEQPTSSKFWQGLPIQLAWICGAALGGVGLILTIIGMASGQQGGWEIMTPIALAVTFIGTGLLAEGLEQYLQPRQHEPRPLGSQSEPEQQGDKARERQSVAS